MLVLELGSCQPWQWCMAMWVMCMLSRHGVVRIDLGHDIVDKRDFDKLGWKQHIYTYILYIYLHLERNKDKFWKNLRGWGIEVDPFNLIPNLQLEMKTSYSFSACRCHCILEVLPEVARIIPKVLERALTEEDLDQKTVKCIHPSKMLFPFFQTLVAVYSVWRTVVRSAFIAAMQRSCAAFLDGHQMKWRSLYQWLWTNHWNNWWLRKL